MDLKRHDHVNIWITDIDDSYDEMRKFTSTKTFTNHLHGLAFTCFFIKIVDYNIMINLN